MSTTGRTLVSTSRAANTGMRSAGDVPGLGALAEFTVFLAFKDSGNNVSDTIWADENGGCQIFITSSSSRVFVRYGNNTSGGAFANFGSGWNFIAVRMGLDIDGFNDVAIDIYRTATADVATGGLNTYASPPLIEGDSVHYLMGDDAGGGPTDDGCDIKVFGAALVEGLWTLDELGCDTTTGQAKAFDAGAEAALVYALRGQTTGLPGDDNSGNGNDFLIESSGVAYDEADLPPGVSLPAVGGTTLTAALFSPAVSFPAATLDLELSAGALTASPTFPTAEVVQATFLDASIFSTLPTFPAISVEYHLAVSLGEAAPTFPSTDLSFELTAGGFATSPSFPTMDVDELTGLFVEQMVAAPIFPLVSVESHISVSLFTANPSFPASSVEIENSLSVGAFNAAPSFPAMIARDLVADANFISNGA